MTMLRDNVIIFANLLALNVRSLKLVSPDERLMLLVQNRGEVPLSPLHTTLARVCVLRGF